MLWIRIRKDPELFVESGPKTRGFKIRICLNPDPATALELKFDL
jgi:hypothetical protein